MALNYEKFFGVVANATLFFLIVTFCSVFFAIEREKIIIFFLIFFLIIK